MITADLNILMRMAACGRVQNRMSPSTLYGPAP